MGQSSWSNNNWGPSPNKPSILGKGPHIKVPGVYIKIHGVGALPGDVVSVKGLYQWVVKPLQRSLSSSGMDDLTQDGIGKGVTNIVMQASYNDRNIENQNNNSMFQLLSCRLPTSKEEI